MILLIISAETEKNKGKNTTRRLLKHNTLTSQSQHVDFAITTRCLHSLKEVPWTRRASVTEAGFMEAEGVQDFKTRIFGVYDLSSYLCNTKKII